MYACGQVCIRAGVVACICIACTLIFLCRLFIVSNRLLNMVHGLIVVFKYWSHLVGLHTDASVALKLSHADGSSLTHVLS